MKVARVLGRLTIDDTRVSSGRVVVGRIGFVEIDYHLTHRISVLGEANGIFGFVFGKFTIERLVITKEATEGAEVGLGSVVVTADDGVVRALKETIFAIMHKLRGGQ